MQICATLDRLDPLNALMRSSVSGLVLSAGWSKAKGFDIEILLPTPTVLSFGNNIRTTPFKLGIQTKPLNLASVVERKVIVVLMFLEKGAGVTEDGSGWRRTGGKRDVLVAASR